MESIKPSIKKPLRESTGNSSGPGLKTSSKKRKSVSFAESPEKPSKRQAQAKHIATPKPKTPTQKSNRVTLSARYAENALLWTRLKHTPKLIHKTVPGRARIPPPHEKFKPPTKPTKPFDPERDWFTSMHVSMGCTASPAHVIGVKMNGDRRQCEGIEGLDYRLQSGQVKVLFHPRRGHEPVCETCWTIAHPEADDLDLKIPGSWPKDPPKEDIYVEPSPHTHIFNVVYQGCKHKNMPWSPKRHSMKLVKGEERHGGTGTMCQCTSTNDYSQRSKVAGSAELITTQVFMPDFAGCPACEGKNLKDYVRRYHNLC
ncbi:hypothetical protein TWF506_007456 [Arthrobotrys conoides]|uniref:Uncharacterized protein n=1 Tax=Arthrobotrys conoides TaxID=74498 RepID=A0AAN8NFQ5_9PEZI